MRTTISVSEETKDELTQLKPDDESWDQFLARLAAEYRPVDVSAWTDADADRARDAVDESRQSFER